MGERTYTESQIEDKHVSTEVFLVPTALSSREIGCRRAPKVRVDTFEVFSNINRDKQLSRPEPNLDAVILATYEGIVSTSNHWGRGPLETGGNMLGTLKGQELFTWHFSTQHISGTCVMFLAHFPYM